MAFSKIDFTNKMLPVSKNVMKYTMAKARQDEWTGSLYIIIA